MAGEGEGSLFLPIVFFSLVVILCASFIVIWLSKRTKDKSYNKDSTKTQRRGSNLQQKPKGGTASKPVKKKAPLPKVTSGVPQHKFEHPHLLATLKGHTGPLTGGDFSSSGKQFITSAEVVKACSYGVPCLEDKDCSRKLQYKALNHNEEDVNMWTPTSLSSCSNTPSDTEDSLTSSSSCSSKMSRRQKKNKKRKKANTLLWDNKKHTTKATKSDDSSVLINKSDDIRIETICSAKRNKSPHKSGKSVKKCGFKSDAAVHRLLLPLCVEVQERILSGYPYQTYRGTYVFKSFGFSRLESVLGNHRLVDAEIKDVDLKNSSDVLDEDSSSQNFMENSSDFNDNFKGNSNFQKCERCRQFFDVCGNGRTLCMFHPRKAVLTSEGSLRYTCCNSLRNGGGCQVYNYHVFHHLSLGINGPLGGYVSTRSLNRPPRVFGLDCEMVFTTFGFEVARATLVDVYGEPLIDNFIIPEGQVLDYNTQFSGVTEQNLMNALPFKQVQEMFLAVVSSSDILVGHSLEGDLVVLKLLHRRVVDSSLLFLDSSQHESNITGGVSALPRRQGLKSLVKEHLGQDIQVEGSCGHNSLEDATASLNLVLNKVCGEPVRNNQRKNKIAPIPPMLHAITA